MSGLGDNDTYFVNVVTDQVNEATEQGFDHVIATSNYVMASATEVEKLTTTGATSTYDTSFVANGFDNIIEGNAGANAINGAGGTDTLTGNDGSDTFRFSTALAATNIDTITDFVAGEDRINLLNTVFTGLDLGTLAAEAFNTGAAATEADDRIIYNDATGALIFDSNGNAAGGAAQFAILSTGLELRNTDFFVF